MTFRSNIRTEAFFLETDSGPRFAIVTRPSGPPKGGWLFLHPFAEEMNKSRRMVALCSRLLAEKDWLVLQIDFGGCGDSFGDFGDASWQGWLDDISLGWEWLNCQCGSKRGIWALRAGCLLATDWLKRMEEHPSLLFWQPVLNGGQHLAQFLRLKVVSEALSASGKLSVARLRTMLEEGRAIEIAGYQLSPALAEGLNSSRLSLPDEFKGSAAIFEIVPENRMEHSPGIETLAEAWTKANVPVTATAVHGPRFWQTVEVETAPALLDATVRESEKFQL